MNGRQFLLASIMAHAAAGETKGVASTDPQQGAVDLRDVTWLSLRLADVRLSYATPSHCVKYKFVYTGPMLRLELADSDGQNRFQLWRLPEVEEGKSSTTLAAGNGRFLTYYYRNATLATSLIGHNSQFVDPKRKPEILESSQPVDVAMALSAGRADVSGVCYNATVLLERLDPADFVPTTTGSELADGRGSVAHLEAGGPLFQSITSGSLNAPAPLWLVVLAGSLLCCSLAAFCALCVAHVRARRAHRHCGHQHTQLKLAAGESPSPGDTIATKGTDRRTGFRYMAGTVPLPAHCNGNNSSHTTSASSCCTAPPVPAANYGPLHRPPPSLMGVAGHPHPHPHPQHARGQQPMVDCVVRAAGSDEEESHYDVPWEHRWRPLPEWLRSDLATSLAYSNATAGGGQPDEPAAVPTVTPVPVRPPAVQHNHHNHHHNQQQQHRPPARAYRQQQQQQCGVNGGDELRLCA